MKTDRKRSGQTMVEYIIIVVVIAIAALAVFGIFGDVIRGKTSGAVNSLDSGENAQKASQEAGKSSADQLRNMTKDGIQD